MPISICETVKLQTSRVMDVFYCRHYAGYFAFSAPKGSNYPPDQTRKGEIAPTKDSRWQGTMALFASDLELLNPLFTFRCNQASNMNSPRCGEQTSQITIISTRIRSILHENNMVRMTRGTGKRGLIKLPARQTQRNVSGLARKGFASFNLLLLHAHCIHFMVSFPRFRNKVHQFCNGGKDTTAL